MNVPDNGTADLLSTRGRKIELALQFASSSIPGEVLAESPYKTLVQSLSAEALDLYVDGSTTVSIIERIFMAILSPSHLGIVQRPGARLSLLRDGGASQTAASRSCYVARTSQVDRKTFGERRQFEVLLENAFAIATSSDSDRS